MKKSFLPLLALLLLTCFHSFATVYYNKASSGGVFNAVGSWGTATNGTGTAPANFTTSGDVFNISNGTTYTVSGNWTLGAGVAANIGSGITVTIPTGTNRILGAGTLNLLGTATLNVQNATEPNLGTCSATSTVVYGGNVNDIQATTYGNLTITATPVNFGVGTTTVAGNYVQSAGLATLTSTNAAYTLNVTGNFTLSGNACFVVDDISGASSSGTVNVGGNLLVSSTGGAGSGGPTGDNVAIVLTGASASGPIGIFQVNGDATFTSSSGYYLDFGFGTGAGMAATYFGVKGNLSVSGGGEFYTTSSTAAKGIFFNGTGTSAAPQQFTYASSVNSDYVSYLVNTGTYVQMQSDLVLSPFSGPYSTFGVNGTLDCKTFTFSGGASAGGVQINSGSTLISANVAASGAVNGAITATGSTFSTGANYVFNGAAAQTTGNKMPSSIVSPGSVTINNASGVTLTQSTSIGAGCALNFTTGKLALASTTLTLNGTVTGMSAAKSITGSASSNLTIGATGSLGTLFFDQTTAGTSNNIATLTINGAGGNATLGNALNAGATLNLYDGTLNNSTFLTVANNATINRDNGILSSVPTWGSGGTGLVNVVYTTGGPATATVTTGNELPVTATNLNNLTVAKTGATVTLGAAVTVNGALTLTAGTLDVSASNFGISLKGNWLNNASATSFTPRSATLSLIGAATQTIGGAFSSTFNNVTLNTTGAILGRDENINGTLTFTSGSLDIGANNLIFGTAATAVAGTPSASSMIIATGSGQVRKLFSSNGSFLYPVGDNVGPNYTPVTLNVAASAYSGSAYVGVKVVKAKHPSNANVNNYINRYWPVTTSGLTSPSYAVTAATYVVGDVVGTEGNISMGYYPAALPWTKFGATVTATHTMSSTAVTNVSGDFSGISTAGPSITGSPDVAFCGSGSATLTTTLISGDPTVTYSWAPAAGLSATIGISVTATPATPTTYTVTATDGNGFTSTATTTVSINPVPSLTGASNNGPVCAGATLSLSANGASNVAGYSWTGPVAITGAATASASVPATTASASGIYTVVVNNGAGTGCTATYTTSATVNSLPTISGVTASSSNLCVGASLTLNAGTPSGSGSLVSYNWSGPNGFSTTTSANSTVLSPGSTAASGSYSLSVTYPDAGCTSNAAVTVPAVTVNALPAVASITPSSTEICTGSLLTLNAGSVTGAGTLTSYNWSGPNGFSTTTSGNSTAFTPASSAASGNYSVTVTYTGTGCTSNTVATTPAVTVNSLPAITSVTPSATSLCVGSSLTLTATGSGSGALVSYNWTGPNGYSTTTATNSVSLTPSSTAFSGSYSVSVTYSGAGCSSAVMATTAVTVNAQPTISGISASAYDLCAGSPLTLTAGTTSGSGSLVSYNWTGPNGYSSTTATGSVLLAPSSTAASGDYSLTVTYAGSGCTSNAAITSPSVTVNAASTVAGITPSTTELCTGNLLTLTAGATTGSGTFISYNWTGPNGFSTTTATNSTSFTPSSTAASGNYSVSVTYSGAGCTSAQAVTSPAVTVNALPAVASIAPSSTNICVGAVLTLNAATATGTGSLISYNWSGPGGYSAATTVPSVALTPSSTAFSGAYSVSVTYPGTGCTSAAAVTSPSVTVNALPAVASVTPSATTLCVGAPLTLSAGSVTGAGSLVAYNWSGPAGYSATTAEDNTVLNPPSVAASGNYSVTVTYPGTGCTSVPAVTSSAVTVNAMPTVAGITPSSTNICTGSLLTFTAGSVTGAGTLTSYNWTGPNSFSTTTASNTTSFTPTTASASGSYSVSVTYSGSGCTSSASVTTVTVNALPTVASITPSATTICTGSALTLNAGSITGSGAVTSYNWSGPNSYSVTTSVAQAIFTVTTTAEAGVYSLSVTYPGTGCTSAPVTSSSVAVNNKPVVTGIVAAPGTLCAGSDLTLTGSGAAGTGSLTSYNWTGPNGYNSQTTGSVQTYAVPNAAASGIYSLTVTYPGTGCTSDAVSSSAVTVNPAPTAYTVTGGGTYCSGGTGVSVGLSNSGAGIDYQLYYGSSTLGAVVHGTGTALDFGMMTGAGSYSVRATNTGTSCVNAMTGTAVVSISAVPTAYSMTGGGNYCAGTGGVHIGLLSSDNGVGYQLYNGASTVGGLVTGTGSALDFGLFTTDGTYTVVANPGSACAILMTGSATILTYPLPNPYNVTGGGAICAGSTGVHIGLDWSVTGVNYQLYNGATAVGTPVPGSSSPLDFGLMTGAGTYTVVATNATTTCMSNMTGSAIITVNPTPIQYAVTGGGTTCEGTGAVSVGLANSETGVNYQLYNGASATGSPVTGTGSSITFGSQSATGTYTVLGVNNTTSCTMAMTGSASVTIDPAPTAIALTGGGHYCTGGAGQPVGLATSASGINYQLYNGATMIGSAVSGSGSAISFGLQTMAGTYTVLATNTATTCTGAMSGNAVVVMDALPFAYTATGGGSYCSGNTGVAVGVNLSSSGVNYQLYNGATAVGSSVSGTGSAISFGLHTVAGTYTVLATDATTTCTNSMTGNAVISINALPTVYNVTGGGNYCLGSLGSPVGLDNSNSGISYQLYTGSTPVGSPVSGTGSAISFGLHTDVGSYSVIATNTSTSCVQNMSGSVVIGVNSLPGVFSVTGGGSYCAGGAGVVVSINSSESGINYQLYNGALTSGSPVAGTGSALAFPAQTNAGTYSVVGTNPVTSCSSNMSGSTTVVVNPLPTAYNVTGGGAYCSGGAGVNIGLDYSVTGITYQLYYGSTPAGSPVAGIGAAIDFGSMTGAGTYTVRATNTTTTCSGPMAGSAVVTINALPVAYNVSGGGTYCENQGGLAVGVDNTETGTNYQLYNGATMIGSAIAGTGSAISFGLQTLAGTYTVLATNTTTACSNAMAGNAVIIMNPAPAVFNVTGGGNVCIGTAGAAIGISNSVSGINYQLYRGTTAIGGPFAGTGSPLSFGLYSVAGTYTVQAMNNVTACTSPMTGSAVITLSTPPTAYNMGGGGSFCLGSTGVPVSVSSSQTGVNYQLYNGSSMIGSPVAGTGAGISFGNFTVGGTYSVLATNTTTSCTKAMTGISVVVVNLLPNVYSVSGGGNYCAGGEGAHVGMVNTNTGINYQLYYGSSAITAPQPGSGTSIDFGPQYAVGSYSVRAINASTGCQANMSGSATVGVNAAPASFTVTGGGTNCSNASGVAIGLSNSVAGINYQLYRGGTPVGSFVGGTNAPLSFGLQTVAGTYTVLATNSVTGCTAAMTGSASVTVVAAPSVYTVTGGGNYCPGGAGVNIGLTGSDINTLYQSFVGAASSGSPVTGTGATLNLGVKSVAGTYTVVATSILTGCSIAMSGSASVGTYTLPAVYNVTGGGSYCSGSGAPAVGLSNSESGVTYRLYIGTSIVSILSGTGTGLNFGSQSAAGTYTVQATNNTTACVSNMSGSAVITINPLPTLYTVSGGGSYCAGGSGFNVQINGSDIGVNYQLYNGSTPLGAVVGGTGASINFGVFTAAGAYTVRATNATTFCARDMTGSATIIINPLPTVYSVSGGGNYCAGSSGVNVGLLGSDAGISYRLYNGSSIVAGPVTSPGGTLNFGLQLSAGVYTAAAVNPGTGCASGMSSSVTVSINPLPSAYNVTGGGAYCSGGTGVNIGVDWSVSGVNYQLYRGSAAIGSAVTGINGPLSFGLQTVTGTYSVAATDPLTLCAANMTGTKSVSINPLPAVYDVTGGGNYCTGGSGVSISLSGSDVGINYNLYRGSVVSGTSVPGVNGVVSFGSRTASGTYTAVATNATTGCSSNMNGSATINIIPLPVAFAVTGGGSFCVASAGVTVGLLGSTPGISYRLYKGGLPFGTPVAGTGSAISFGVQTVTGTYSVLATDPLTSCTNFMSGTAVVNTNPAPFAYSLTGGGSYCTGGAGVVVGLSGSATGVSYSLYRDGVFTGSVVTGNGLSIDFGLQTTSGIYTVMANNTSTGCSATMAGNSIVTVSPLPYAYHVNGGGSYCSGGAGLAVYINGSDPGVNYQLYRGATAVGSVMPGSGYAMNFGLQTIAGNYTVLAADAATTCFAMMTGGATVSINSTPAAFAVTGGGSFCTGASGVSVGINGSEVGVTYYLYNGSAIPVASQGGIGSAIDFGLQTVSGTYTVAAINPSSSCSNNMSGSVSVVANARPQVFDVTGGGDYCAASTGVHIGLNGSQSGVNYRLYNGSVIAHAPVAGSGAELDFGIITAIGDYTVSAVNPSTGCSSDMSGLTTVAINPRPAAFAVTGGGNYCSGGTGVNIGVSGSEAGVNYKLYRLGVLVGSPVAGTGGAISFGPQALTGAYTVVAENASTGCIRNQSGSATISVNPAPVAFDLSSGGSYCTGGAGVNVLMSGSETGVMYQLYKGTLAVGSFGGTGSGLDFGAQVAGTYTVRATNTATSCTSGMNGNSIITTNALPTAYNVTGGGNYCTGGNGVHVGLSGSENSVTYQLYLGSALSGAPVTGTGAALDFGLKSFAGNYSVVATNTAGCSRNMALTAAVAINPLPASYEVTGGGSYCNGGSGVHIGLNGSATGISYRLYNGASAVGATVAGTGSNIDFGSYTATGTYSVVATNTATSCASGMTGDVAISINARPVAHTVTGGGAYCPGGAGVHITVMGTDAGVNYQLYTAAGPYGAVIPGGSDVDFGLQTTVGAYSVIATDATNACTSFMSNSVAVSLNSLPGNYNVVAASSGYCAGGPGVNVSLTGSAMGVEYQLYYNGSIEGAAVPGTGTSISFGPKTAAGIYTVAARDLATTCSATMTGSPLININPLPVQYAVTGGGSYCAGGVGVVVGLAASDPGVNYQLYNGSSPVGVSVAGSGAPLSFGLKTAAGTYSVIATSSATGCNNQMGGTVAIIINALPAATSVTGGGNYCAGSGGVHVGLLSTAATARYQLYNGAATVGAPVTGTGTTLDFGVQSAAGTYTVRATNIANTCGSDMTGSAAVVINALPPVFAVTGGGGYCNGSTGVHVGLIGSTPGVNYRLYNGSSAVGATIAGTGTAIDFGVQAAIGTYSVLATNASTTCSRGMTGSVAVSINPSPEVYNVTGGGGYCAGSAGAHIGLDNSATGINYLLYSGSTLSGTYAGTGSNIDFGPKTITGLYTVTAVNAATGCMSNMNGGATVSVTPVVVPSVSVTSGVGTDICAGTLAVFTTTQVNGGSSPAYQWKVNGANVGFATGTYSYFPADGDVVSVALTSSATCALPATVSSSLTMTVRALQTPVVTDAVSPGDTVCSGTMVTFTATPLYGGSAPSYTWIKNGSIAGTGNTYSYVPADGDIVYSKMVSNYGCVSANNVSGNSIKITVANPVAPSVAIVANPGTKITEGQSVTFTAIVTNTGNAPTYQWLINGGAILGATNATFTGNSFFTGDSITCQVTNEGPCGSLLSFNSVVMTVNSVGVVKVGSADIDVKIFPNPNNGTFTIKGNVGTANDNDVYVEVTDLLGQVVFRKMITHTNGVINEHIALEKALASGMYMLNLQSGTEHKVFQVMVQQ